MNEMELHNHIETSAKTGMNIGNLFEILTKHLYLENIAKLGEFRNDEDQGNNARSSSISFRSDKKNVDLYAPKKQPKKKNCAC